VAESLYQVSAKKHSSLPKGWRSLQPDSGTMICCGCQQVTTSFNHPAECGRHTYNTSKPHPPNKGELVRLSNEEREVIGGAGRARARMRVPGQYGFLMKMLDCVSVMKIATMDSTNEERET